MGKDKSSKAAKAAKASSLSSFLLAKVDAKDAALDSIFSNSQGPSKAFQPSSGVPSSPALDKAALKEQKRKERSAAPEPPTPKATSKSLLASPPAESDSEDEGVANDEDLSELDSDESLGLSDDEDEGIEEAYAAKKVAERLKALASGGAKSNKGKKPAAAASDSDDEQSAEEENDSEEQSELEIDRLMKESVLPKAIYKEVPATAKEVKKAKEKAKKAKLADDETPEERDARTIFIGNVPVECSQTRPMKKAIIRHLLQSEALLALLPPNCPPLKANSIRFRSLAFASTVFGRKGAVGEAGEGESTGEPGGRGRKRARDWRNDEDTDARGVRGGFRQKEAAPEPVSPAEQRKGALTDGQKRRIAFFRGELNEGKKVCNAYLVLDKLPASFTTLTIKEVLDLVVKTADGSTFEGFHIRADHVRARSTAALTAAAQMTARPNANVILPATQAPNYSVPPAEARRTLFVGGLDFAETEESVRKATEDVLVREKGAAEASGEKSWVEGVRLIRDASTGLGKGFGYVLLRNVECVDELLVLPPGKNLKVSKRKVRLERCKTGIAAARAKAAAATRDQAAPAPKASSSSVSKSAGVAFAPRDPSLSLRPPTGIRALPSSSASEHQSKLAEALKALPADERKKIKAVDPARLMRRAEKKKNKVLGERFERKLANEQKKSGAAGILGRETRREERTRKEKKRVAAGNKTGKRAKPIKPY